MAGFKPCARTRSGFSLSSVTPVSVDVENSTRIASLGKRVLAGGQLTRDEAMGLFHLEDSADIYDLLAWANRIRERFKGNKVHLCSIVNAKAGACSENCRFCSQSSFYQTGSPKYGFVDPEPVLEAADEAQRNGVTAVGLVAAWKGLQEGPMLDEVCDRIRDLAASGKTRADASLGLIKSQRVADRLKEAGLECYGHNLESSRRFFPNTCTTHSYDDRLETIGYLKNAGLKICSGGIIGMGETREDRCDLAFSLKEIGANVVPINILNPIKGTPFEHHEPLAPLEILKTIACFRFILPRQEIMIAGGRTVNLRDLQPMVFLAGASALMVGSYLTTLNQPVEKDLQMLKDLGLDPDWDKHDFADQRECGCSAAPDCDEPATAAA
ncbi:MAG: biotin synthase BioB [Verrucomicrobia bacterium]|nr:biotin synthase BioB [Verrucomicrobiota bacterium]